MNPVQPEVEVSRPSTDSRRAELCRVFIAFARYILFIVVLASALLFMLILATPNGVSIARQYTDAVIDHAEDFSFDGKAQNAGHHGKQSQGVEVEFKKRR